MNVHEQQIRDLAYQIWESEGKPHGQAARHWDIACKLATESADAKGTGQPLPATAKTSKTPSTAKTTKPRKTAAAKEPALEAPAAALAAPTKKPRKTAAVSADTTPAEPPVELQAEAKPARKTRSKTTAPQMS